MPLESVRPTTDIHADLKASLLERSLRDGRKPSLVAKLAEVMSAVDRIPKRGHNDFHNYDYATEADIVDAVRKELAARGVVLIPEVVSCDFRDMGTTTDRNGNTKARDPLTVLKMSFTFRDAESDETISVPWFGVGQDPGDKGIYKAMTGGLKYALMKTFLMPTGDDPERTTKEERRETKDRDKATVTAPRAGKKARPPAPDGAVYIEKVIPKTKGNLSWDEVVFSTGVSLVARVPQLGALCAAIAQDGVPVVVETHKNGKGNEELDMVRRWAPEPVDVEYAPSDKVADGLAITAADIGF